MVRFLVWWGIVAGCAAGSITGCHSVASSSQAGRVEKSGHPQIAVLDDLENRILLGDPMIESGSDQPISVSVPIRVAGNDDLVLQYRFEFFDSFSKPIESLISWRHLFLPPGVERFLEGSAASTAAVDWRLEVRTPHTDSD